MDRGIVYACSHPKWVDETLRSAASCRRCMPDLARELYITRSLLNDHADQIGATFTRVVALDPIHEHRPRFDAMARTRLDEAIFIDGDTLFLSPVTELFGILEQFDVALAPAPQFLHPKALVMGIYDLLPPVSRALPEWNSGVIVARVTDKWRRFAESWSAMFQTCMAHGYDMDQPSLRSALVSSDLRFVNLPPIYNFRANVAQTVTGAVKVLHAHGDLEELAKTINHDTRGRLYRPNRDLVEKYYPKDARGSAEPTPAENS